MDARPGGRLTVALCGQPARDGAVRRRARVETGGYGVLGNHCLFAFAILIAPSISRRSSTPTRAGRPKIKETILSMARAKDSGHRSVRDGRLAADHGVSAT